MSEDSHTSTSSDTYSSNAEPEDDLDVTGVLPPSRQGTEAFLCLLKVHRRHRD